MELKLDKHDLNLILKSFHIATGLRIVIFDQNGKEITSYPEKGNNFCLEMQKNCLFAEACEKSNRHSFKNAQKTNILQLYKCHAGLIEASMPLIVNNETIGYAMFGQIAEDNDKENLEYIIKENIEQYGISHIEHLNQILFFSKEKLVACQDLLNACISYIISNKIITYKKDTFLTKIDEYIKNNISFAITPLDIAYKFGISRTSLYNLFRDSYQMGVGEYILFMKINHAKYLLDTTFLKVNEIATKCGFNDYNYFTKVFKLKTSISPTKYRKKN